ncbi:Increased rDNA silencing protein [Aspergillus hancockii]|nr:Increased rDNA silencing protein [Aspergillus hancockii]
MASSTPALNRRAPPRSSRDHVNTSAVTALQGATTAFRAGPTTSTSRGMPPAVVNHRSGAATDVNNRGLGPGARPELESEVPPEVGSVKDKIGMYTARSQNTGSVPRKSVPLRPQSPQQIAARIATGQSSAPKNTATTPGNGMRRGANEPQPQGSNYGQVLNLLTSSSTGSTIAKSKPVELSSSSGESLPNRNMSIRRKPVMQLPNTPLDPTQPAVLKSRPTPPAPRKARPVPSDPGSAAPATKSVQSSELNEPLSSRSSVRSKASSTMSSEIAPALPPRPNQSPMPKEIPNDQRALLRKSELPRRPLSPGGSSIYSRTHNSSRMGLRDDSPGLSEGALSDAIVASSLASARAPPPRSGAPPPPPRRRARSRSLLHRHASGEEASQALSPSKSLRYTLRSPPGSDDEGDAHQRHTKHLIRKHPHKHHEGDRRRWRSELTEKERKRYEGVWAANKGLVVPTKEEVDRQCSQADPLREKWPPNASEMVANIVVRDIWSRSRLPFFVLEQIWNLVDTQSIGLLTREEFVVGMWLIDQQLKGHKLPTKVPDSVWASVKRIPGINLRDIDFHA